MKKGFLKKMTVLMLAGTLICTTFGCGKKEETDDQGYAKVQSKDEKKEKSDKKSDAKEPIRDVMNMVYEGSDFSVSEMVGDINKVLPNGDKLYFLTSEYIQEMEDEEEVTIYIPHIYSVDMEGNDFREYKLPEFVRDDTLWSLSVLEDGTFLFLINNYDREHEKTSYRICKSDLEGQVLLDVDIMEYIEIPNLGSISDVVVDKNGNIAVVVNDEWYPEKVYLFNDKIELLGNVKVDFLMQGMVKTKDGDIVCGCSESGEEGSYIRFLDTEKQEWGKSIEILEAAFTTESNMYAGLEYDFYYYGTEGIYGYDIEEEQATQLIDFEKSNVTLEDSYRIQPVAKEKFFNFVFRYQQPTELMMYHKVENPVIDSEPVTFATRGVTPEMQEAAYEYNEKYPEYKIEFIDYNEFDDPIAEMNKDMMAGELPDIIDLREISANVFVSKGMLLDLTPYLETDEELSEEDFIPAAWEALKTDGKLYFVSSSFGISTMIARSSDVGDKKGWDFKELKELVDKKGENVKPFTEQYKMETLNIFSNCFGDYVDWETGKCYFEEDEFKYILELCNRGKDENDNTYNSDEPGETERLRSGEVLFKYANVNPYNLQINNLYFDEDITCIGYPTKDKNGSYIHFYDQLSISAKSENKDAAWKFVRMLLTRDYQGRAYDTFAIQTRKDVFEMQKKAFMTTESYTDEYGKLIEPLDGGFGDGEISFSTHPVTQEEMDQFMKLLNSVKKRDNFDQTIIGIVEEEAQAYFAGDKSVDETAKIIQDRVTKYVNENR